MELVIQNSYSALHKGLGCRVFRAILYLWLGCRVFRAILCLWLGCRVFRAILLRNVGNKLQPQGAIAQKALVLNSHTIEASLTSDHCVRIFKSVLISDNLIFIIYVSLMHD
jgi:hypothetical protein